jgi:glycerophosphoryl diester phosphodiesterase
MPFEVTGHRGAAGLVPENTLPSFARALELGVDGVELDIHLSADGVPVVIHDARVDRTTSGHGAVVDLTAAELAALGVPTLAQVLHLIGDRAVISIELKATGTPAPAVAAVRAAGLESSVRLISFQFDLLAEVKALAPELAVVGILGAEDRAAIDRSLVLGARQLDVCHVGLTREFVDVAHAASLRVRAWTPNTAEEMRAVLALGVDGITTDRPDIALEVRARG